MKSPDRPSGGWHPLCSGFLFSLAACGGRAYSTQSVGVALDAGTVTVPALHLPSGTIAVGMQAGGVAYYPPDAMTGTAPLGQLNWSPSSYLPQYLAFDANGDLYINAFGGDPDAGSSPPAPDASPRFS